MQMRALFLCIVGLGLASLVSAESVVVTGARVNVRSAASMDSPIVAMVKSGDRLEARKVGSDWVAIAPPADMEFWVHSDFIEEGRVVGNDVNVRSGPSIRDVTLVQLPRGSAIQLRRESGRWLLIEPPGDLTLWISRVLVQRRGSGFAPPAPVETPRPVVADVRRVAPREERPEPVRPVRAPSPPPQRVPAPVVVPVERRAVPVRTPPPPVVDAAPVVRAPTPPPTVPAVRRRPYVSPVPVVPDTGRQGGIALQDVPDRDATRSGSSMALRGGERVRLRGVVQVAPSMMHQVAAYRLVERGTSRSLTVGYLRGDAAALDRAIGREVDVEGQSRLAVGARHPVIHVVDLRAR